MRLFVAICLEDAIRDALCRASGALREQAQFGRFTHRNNLHLTLAFIGETARLADAKRAMASVRAAPFSLTIGGMGRFARRGGDLYWAGAELCGPLAGLQAQVADALRKQGFSLDDKPFKPHLTLAREVRLSEPPDENALAKRIPQMGMRVERITLMKSERLQGKLTYTPLYHTLLEEQV